MIPHDYRICWGSKNSGAHDGYIPNNDDVLIENCRAQFEVSKVRVPQKHGFQQSTGLMTWMIWGNVGKTMLQSHHHTYNIILCIYIYIHTGSMFMFVNHSQSWVVHYLVLPPMTEKTTIYIYMYIYIQKPPDTVSIYIHSIYVCLYRNHHVTIVAPMGFNMFQY